jgi:hypothetical protein
MLHCPAVHTVKQLPTRDTRTARKGRDDGVEAIYLIVNRNYVNCRGLIGTRAAAPRPRPLAGGRATVGACRADRLSQVGGRVGRYPSETPGGARAPVRRSLRVGSWQHA